MTEIAVMARIREFFMRSSLFEGGGFLIAANDVRLFEFRSLRSTNPERFIRHFLIGGECGSPAAKRCFALSRGPNSPLRGSNPAITSTTNGELCIALTCATRFAVELFGE